jgi:hypothetical protein
MRYPDGGDWTRLSGPAGSRSGWRTAELIEDGASDREVARHFRVSWTLARITGVARRRFCAEYTLAGIDLLLHRTGRSVQVPRGGPRNGMRPGSLPGGRRPRRW